MTGDESNACEGTCINKEGEDSVRYGGVGVSGELEGPL